MLHSRERLIATFLVTFLFCSFINASEFSVGIVPQFEVKKLHATWQPILDALSLKTGHNFKLLGSKTIPEFEASFKRGEFDIIYANPWHAVIANEVQGYVPIIKDGGRSLRGILVVRKDSNISDIKQLDGMEVAFPAPNALGASLLMRADLNALFQVSVIPVYVDTHSSVYLNVILGASEAGGGVIGTLLEQPKKISDQLRILYQTREINPHPICVHSRVSGEDRIQIQKALLELGQGRETKHLFSDVPFLKIEAATIDDYSILKTWGLRNFYVEE